MNQHVRSPMAPQCPKAGCKKPRMSKVTRRDGSSAGYHIYCIDHIQDLMNEAREIQAQGRQKPPKYDYRSQKTDE